MIMVESYLLHVNENNKFCDIIAIRQQKSETKHYALSGKKIR